MLGSAASAGVVFQSVDLGANPNAYICSECQGSLDSLGESFSLSSGATVASFDFTAAASDPSLSIDFGYSWPTSVTVGFYDDAGGTVGTQTYAETISSFASDQHQNVGPLSGDELVHAVLSTPVALAAGNYLVFLTAPSLMLPSYGYGTGNAVVIPVSKSTYPDLAGDPYRYDHEMGIALCSDVNACATAAAGGAVPEPMTWALMVLGIGMLGASVRRRPLAIALHH